MISIPSNTKTYLCALLEHKNESNPNDNVYVNLKEYRKCYFAEQRADLPSASMRSPRSPTDNRPMGSIVKYNSKQLDLKTKKGEKTGFDKMSFGGAGTGINEKPRKYTPSDWTSGFLWATSAIDTPSEEQSQLAKYGLGPDASLADVAGMYALGSAGPLGQGIGALFGKKPGSKDEESLLKRLTKGGLGFIGSGIAGALKDLTGKSYIDLQAQAFGPEYAGNVVAGAGSPPVTLYTPQTQYSQQNWLSSIFGGYDTSSTSRRRRTP